MLSRMRDRRGGPSAGVRLLALLVAVLLAGPLIPFVVRVAARVLDLAL